MMLPDEIKELREAHAVVMKVDDMKVVKMECLLTGEQRAAYATVLNAVPKLLAWNEALDQENRRVARFEFVVDIANEAAVRVLRAIDVAAKPWGLEVSRTDGSKEPLMLSLETKEEAEKVMSDALPTLAYRLFDRREGF